MPRDVGVMETAVREMVMSMPLWGLSSHQRDKYHPDTFQDVNLILTEHLQ